MKSILKSAAVVAALVMGATACNTIEKDPCETVVCQNGGQTQQVGDSCKCVCDAGYEGADCSTEIRSKFVGTWAASETPVGGGSPDAFSVTIVAGAGINGINIGNFSNVFVHPVAATVDGNNFTIASQEPDGDGYYVVTGTGSINNAGNSISISYTVEDRTGTLVESYSYTGTWTK